MILAPPPSTASSPAETYTAGATLSGHTVAQLSGGQIIAAQLSSPPESIVGVTSGAIASGASGAVIRSGPLGGFTGLVANTVYFLGANGAILPNRPTSGLVMRIGIARDTQTMIIRLSDGIISI